MLTENKLNASSIAYKELLRLNKVFIGFFEIFFRPIVLPFKGSITCKYVYYTNIRSQHKNVYMVCRILL